MEYLFPFFHPKLISIFDGGYVSYRQKIDDSCFFNPIFYFLSFDWEIKTFNVHCYWKMYINSCHSVDAVFRLFLILIFSAVVLASFTPLPLTLFDMLVILFSPNNYFQYLLLGGLMVINSYSLLLSWNIFLLPTSWHIFLPSITICFTFVIFPNLKYITPRPSYF